MLVRYTHTPKQKRREESLADDATLLRRCVDGSTSRNETQNEKKNDSKCGTVTPSFIACASS